MKKILIPIDSSEFSKKALEKAREVAEAFCSDVILLHVVQNNLYYASYEVYKMKSFEENYMKSLKEAGQKLLDDSKEFFIGINNKVEGVIIQGDPSHQIVDFAEKNDDIDLIIMGSNGLSGFQRFLGSVTNRVLHHVEKPILVVK